jgi:hypothetical protein
VVQKRQWVPARLHETSATPQRRGNRKNDAVKRAEKGPLRKGKVLPIQRF